MARVSKRSSGRCSSPMTRGIVAAWSGGPPNRIRPLAVPRMDDDEPLGRFAARALDWPEVRAILVPLAPSPLGARALAELAPRSDDGARAALERAREMQRSLEDGAEPPLD